MTQQDHLDQSLRLPLTPDQHRPTDLHLDRKEGLRIQWADGAASQYSLVTLRKLCPCATCRTEREQKPVALDTVAPTSVPLTPVTPDSMPPDSLASDSVAPTLSRWNTTPPAPQTRPLSSIAASGSLSLNILPANIDRATQFTNARTVGNYALQITWADGHSTGIYDFRYLRAIHESSQTKGPIGAERP